MSDLQEQPSQPTLSAKTRARLIMNPHAYHGTSNEDIIAQICALLDTHGIAAEPAVTAEDDHGEGLAREAAQEGIPIVIAVGGDGTVHDVALGLLNTKTALGIIPFGTINNIARSLGIPEDVTEACALIGKQAPRPIDTGLIDGEPFFEAVSIGFEAPLFPLGESARHKGFFGALKALVSGIRIVAHSQSKPIDIELDGKRRRVRAQQITICNTPRYGIGFIAAPDARVDDGQLDVVIVRHSRRIDLIRHYWSIMNGNRAVDRRVRIRRARRIRVSAKDPMPVAADGNMMGETPVTISVVPRRLLVIAGSRMYKSDPSESPIQNVLNSIAPHGQKSDATIFAPIDQMRRSQRLAEVYWLGTGVLAIAAFITRRLGWWSRLPSPKPAPEIASREIGRTIALKSLPSVLGAIFWRLQMPLEALALVGTGAASLLTRLWQGIKVVRHSPDMVNPDETTMRAVAGMGALGAGLWVSRKPTWRRNILGVILGLVGVWLGLAGRRSEDSSERQRDAIALGAGLGALWLGGTLSLAAWVRQQLLQFADNDSAETPVKPSTVSVSEAPIGGEVYAPVAITTRLERGDIVLFGPDGTFGGRVIEFLTQSHYHHVAIYDGEGMVIEAYPGGTRRFALGQRPITAIRLPVSRAQREAAADWARGHVGDLYDTRGLALIAFDRIFPGLRLGNPSANRFTCAVFIADAYLQVGLEILPNRRWQELVPGDFIYLIDTPPRSARRVRSIS